MHLAITVTLGLLYIYISLLQNPSQLKNIYFILLFLVVKLLALYSIKYGLNHLNIYPVKNNPAVEPGNEVRKTRVDQIEENLATYVGGGDPPCRTPELGHIWRSTPAYTT